MFLLFVSSCATQEYGEVSDECDLKSYKKFPVKNVNYMQRERRSGTKMVKTEAVRCNHYPGSTTCKPVYKKVLYAKMVNVEKTRDTNEESRENWKNNCIKKTCMERYGDKNCSKKMAPKENAPKENSPKEKRKLLDVTKEQLERSGLTLREYANYMKKNNGQRPPPKYSLKEKACSVTGLC